MVAPSLACCVLPHPDLLHTAQYICSLYSYLALSLAMVSETLKKQAGGLQQAARSDETESASGLCDMDCWCEFIILIHTPYPQAVSIL